MQTDDLDQLLARASQNPMRPSEEFLDRVNADAVRLQPVTAFSIRTPGQSRTWGRFFSQLGGGPLLTALGAAAMAGLVIGYINPTTAGFLTTMSGTYLLDSVELFPSGDFISIEG